MNKRQKPRLGKGLSALIGDPVPVETGTEPVHTQNIAPLDNANAPDESSDNASDRSLMMVELSRIWPSPYQPRREIDPSDLTGLAESITQSGVMQPIVVRPSPADEGGGEATWELIAGERRWRAAGLAGLARIPAVSAEVDNQTAAEWSLIENIQRRDLNAMERARALRNLRELFGLTQSEIAQQVGLERSSVANLIRLTELPNHLQELLEEGALTTGHGKALAGALAGGASESAVGSLARDAIANEWSVRELEKRIGRDASVTQGKNGADQPPPESGGTERVSHNELERQLGEHLGTKVRLRTNASGRKGSLTVSFYDLEHFDDLMSRIGFRMHS